MSRPETPTLLRDPRALFGIVVLGICAFAGILAPWLAPHDPAAPLGREAFSLHPPSAASWLGTDIESRDVLSRLLFGARASLLTAAAAASLASMFGAVVGLAAGARGGLADAVLMRTADAFLAVPGILLLLAAGAILGQSPATIIVILALTGWMGTARVVRAEVLVLREREFVLAARGLGFPWRTVLWRHVAPNVLAPIGVSLTLGIGSALAAESVVSFLGFGIAEPVPSWGKMVRDGADRLREGWWVSTWPALAIALCVTAANLLGDALREARES